MGGRYYLIIYRQKGGVKDLVFLVLKFVNFNKMTIFHVKLLKFKIICTPEPTDLSVDIKAPTLQQQTKLLPTFSEDSKIVHWDDTLTKVALGELLWVVYIYS